VHGAEPALTFPGAAGQPLPGVFFYGAEYSPYAAAERWVVVVALARFGTFTDLGSMQSSGSIVFPTTQTFTFSHLTYQSRYVALETDEYYSDQNPLGVGYTVLEHPTPQQAALVRAFAPSADTFPFVDVGNRYVTVGQAGFSPSVLVGSSTSQIAAGLSASGNPVTQAIVASANYLTATVCQVTGQQPAAVCTSPGVLAAARRLGVGPAGD
jgi:hypothetical protein